MITHKEDLGKFILRFTVGFLMIFHGWHKVVNGIDYIGGMLEGYGLPAFISYGVYVGEVLAPIMLILGYRVKIAASLIIATMIMGISLVFPSAVFELTKYGGWKIELNAFFILASFTIIFLGAGKYSIDKD